MIYNLKPVELSQDGLANSIRRLSEKLRDLSPTRFSCLIEGELPRWNETEQLNIYRIVQECLTNIIKHAQAGAAAVEIRRGNGATVISVTDNGKGFDSARVQPGLGLTTLRERAAMLNARLSLESQPGRGTTIILEVPDAQD